jgi:hypothetical protein
MQRMRRPAPLNRCRVRLGFGEFGALLILMERIDWRKGRDRAVWDGRLAHD